MVQVLKEPLGQKGARITSHVSLPGRYLVLMPTVEHVGVSRKITDDEERRRLKTILKEVRAERGGGGFIARTAGRGRSREDFVRDARYLTRTWDEARALATREPAPALLHREPSLVQRLLRDLLSDDVGLDPPRVPEGVRAHARARAPAPARARPPRPPPQRPDAHPRRVRGLPGARARARSKVWLPSAAATS